MRPVVLALATVAMLVSLSGGATAQSAGSDPADVRCLIVLQLVSRDPQQADRANRGIYFYLGKVSARGPLERLEPVMKAEAAKLQQPNAEQELQRCSTELNGRSQEYRAITERLAATSQSKPLPSR